MKIAVLYSGHLRSWDRVKQNQFESFYTIKTDTFFYTYDEPKETYCTQFVKIPGTFYTEPLSFYDSNKNPITCTDNTLQAWHNLFVGFCLVPQDYDVYVKSRCDIELSGKINFEDYDLNDHTVYIPEGNDHCGGVNDQFAFGSYEAMKRYFLVYLNHPILFSRGLTFHTEYYVTENLKALGVNIVRLPLTNRIVRENDEPIYAADSYVIADETPAQHWRMLDVKHKVVLDLGCGRMHDNPTTPEYFLKKEASAVIGVEMWEPERVWYNEKVKDPRLTVITYRIETAAHIKAFLTLWNPKVIKCDIEGQERLFAFITSEELEGVEQIAFEYHSSELKRMIEFHYQTWGFTNIKHYTLMGFDPNEQGVIYIYK